MNKVRYTHPSLQQNDLPDKPQMLSRTALRTTSKLSSSSHPLATRAFRTSAARLSSPYHYPEGPRSNLPFNPLTKYFYVRYWGTMGKYI